MTDLNNKNEQHDPAMETMLVQIEVANFEKRADEIMEKINETGKIPHGMKFEIDPSGEIDHEEGTVYCKAQIPSPLPPQQIKEKEVTTAKKIQKIAVKADKQYKNWQDLNEKIKNLSTPKYPVPNQSEGMKKLLEWSKKQQIQEELIMEKLYPLREWAKKINP